MKIILVIEDDKILSENLRLLLESENYTVLNAFNGEEGLKLIKEFTPNLIVCDINMPKMDGLKFKEELNKDSSFFDIPLIFLTAKTQISDLRTGMNLGADDYIFKPYDSNELLDAIRLRIEKLEKTKEKIKLSVIVNNKTNHEKNLITIKGHDGIKSIKISNIKLIYAEIQYSKIILSDNRKMIFRLSLSEWEKRLPSSIFKRVHRSKIVNMEFVKSHFIEGNKTFLELQNWEEKIHVSRRKLKMLKFKD